MKTVAAGDIQIKVGMVHAVNAPQNRQVVEEDMLEVDDEIEQHHSRDDLDSNGDIRGVEDAPATLSGEKGDPDRESRKEKADNGCIKGNHCEIGKPARSFTGSQLPAGGDEFPQGDDGKDTTEKEETYAGFMIHRDVVTRKKAARQGRLFQVV